MSFQNSIFIHKDKDCSELLMKNAFRCFGLEEENKGLGKHLPPTLLSSLCERDIDNDDYQMASCSQIRPSLLIWRTHLSKLEQGAEF